MSATNRFDDLAARAKRHLWLAFGRGDCYFDDPETALIIERADGHFFVDIHGRRYFDALGAQGTISAGYRNEQIIGAMHEQMQRLAVNPSTFLPHPGAIELAERLAHLAPPGLNKVFFGASGTDGNETALKIIRQYFRLQGQAAKRLVVTRWKGYHGGSLVTTAAGGNTLRRRAFTPLPEGFVHIEPPYCYRCPFDQAHPACGLRCAEELRRVIAYHDPANVAAFMAEPTIGGGGILPGPAGYWRRIREICDEFGLLLLFDEVITGFGRTGDWFESLRILREEGIGPDLITFGKGVTGGYYPLSGVIVADSIAAAFAQSPAAYLHHVYTYGGTPLGAAAALATIDYLKREEIPQKVGAKSERLFAGLKALQQKSRIIGDVRVRGLLLAVELVADKASKATFADPEAVQRFLTAEALRQGLLTAIAGGTINLIPPLTVTLAEIDDLLACLAKVIGAAEQKFAS